MNSSRRADKGFTLLEVMIALAVISIALVALLGLANRSLAVNERIQRLTQATLLAQQKLAEIEAGVTPAGTEDEGRFEAPFTAYRWMTAFTDTPLTGVKMVTVTISWGEADRNETVAMTSFLP